jgi:hypothetical protein
MSEVQAPLHHLRTDRGIDDQGGQEGRLAGPVLARQDQAGTGTGLLEAADRDIERTVAGIENDVYSTFESEIDSRRLGELVMEHLRDLDEVAFVRFASVYRQFADAGDFADELRPLLAGGKQSPK